MDRITALAVVESLKTGVPDEEHVLEYTAPIRLEKSPLREMQGHLDEVAQGISKVRFINGAYGEGKSHTLAILRKIALERGFAVSKFALEAQGVRFDMLDRVLARMVETLATKECPCSSADRTVLEQIIERWAAKTGDIDKALAGLELEPTLPDLQAALKSYARILRGEEPRDVEGRDRQELLRHWFMRGKAGLPARDRHLIGVQNNIDAGNARQFIEGLALFLRKVGHAGWVVLVDEQEIIPTLMTPRQRDKCNENLRVVLDTVNQKRPYRGMYYLFASAPEFFTDEERGVNAYPALRDRIVNAVLDLTSLDENEMFEVSHRLLNILDSGKPGQSVSPAVPDGTIRKFIAQLEDRFGSLRYKSRGFVQSFIALAERLAQDPEADPEPVIGDVLGTVFRSIDAKISEAYH
jgi:hypothetical protein